MGTRLAIALLIVLFSVTTFAQTPPDAADLTKLLNDFLAATTDPAMHERFWADDLIYTRSSGRRISKSEVLRDVRSAPAPKPGDPKTVYTAEDIRIQQYGDTAVVAFRLVGTSGSQVARFLNSGTFVRRNGKWQVVNWQSTRMPRTEEEAKKEVGEATTAFFSALIYSDAKSLRTLIDPSFINTGSGGHQISAGELIRGVEGGYLKAQRLENKNVSINVYGDTAIVRGVREPASVSQSPATSAASPYREFYTIMFVNQGGSWKAVAEHVNLNEKQ